MEQVRSTIIRTSGPSILLYSTYTPSQPRSGLVEAAVTSLRWHAPGRGGVDAGARDDDTARLLFGLGSFRGELADREAGAGGRGDPSPVAVV